MREVLGLGWQFIRHKTKTNITSSISANETSERLCNVYVMCERLLTLFERIKSSGRSPSLTFGTIHTLKHNIMLDCGEGNSVGM